MAPEKRQPKRIMARRKAQKLVANEEDFSPNENYSESGIEENGTEQKKMSYIPMLLVFLIILLGFLLYKNKDLFVVATLNNKPVFAWDLNARLQKQYGKQVLDEMINEQLMFEEANKKGIKVTSGEIDSQINEIKKNLGTKVSLAEALKQQGLTEEDFKKQLELRIILDKLLGAKIKVSGKEIDDYITQNKEQLDSSGATDSASQKKLAENTIKQQKMSQEFQKWFADLKKQAQVNIFLK